MFRFLKYKEILRSFHFQNIRKSFFWKNIRNFAGFPFPKIKSILVYIKSILLTKYNFFKN